MKPCYFIFLFVFSICTFTLSAQKKIDPTNSFIISGEVKETMEVSVFDLSKLTSVHLGDIQITNHSGEARSLLKGLKGTLLRPLLEKVTINAESPKVLSEYYVVFHANDGYKVVFSWNEIFNTSVGASIYIITEKEGLPIQEMKERILLLCASDFRTGRRHVQALSRISVERAK